MARAVLVSDMLRGFMEEGYALYCGAKARRIIPNVQKLLEEELARGSKIFYLCDNHDKLERRLHNLRSRFWNLYHRNKYELDQPSRILHSDKCIQSA